MHADQAGASATPVGVGSQAIVVVRSGTERPARGRPRTSPGSVRVDQAFQASAPARRPAPASRSRRARAPHGTAIRSARRSS